MPERDPFLAALEAVRQAPPPPPSDPFLAALSAVREEEGPGFQSAPGEIERQRAWSMSSARDRAVGYVSPKEAPAVADDRRSVLARGVDQLLTPMLPQAATGARAVAERLDQPRDMTSNLIGNTISAMTAIPDVLRNLVQQPRATLGGFIEGAASSAPVSVARNLVEQPAATLRGGLAGGIEGAGDVVTQYSTPLDVVLTATGPLAGVVSKPIRAALAGVMEAERAIVAARSAGRTAVIPGLVAELNAARQTAARRGATVTMLNAVEQAATGGLVARGVERMATAESLPEAAVGAVETAAGAAGLRGARSSAAVERAQLSLPAGPRFVSTPTGEVVPAGVEIPMRQTPDGSYVRAVPAEYARREVRGELPPARGFVVDEAGRAAPVEAGADVFLRSLTDVRAGTDPSRVTSQRAAIAGRDFEGRTVTRTQYSGDIHATDAPLIDLSPEETQGLRWLREELDNLPFVKRGFQDAGVRRGGDLEVIPGAAGAPIYNDIIQVRGSRATRGDVIEGIDKLLSGEQSAVGQDARVIAKRLMAGDQTLRRRMQLPPEAGQATIARLADEPAVPMAAGGEAGQPQAASALDDFEQFDQMLGDVNPGDLEPGEYGRISPQLAARGGGAIVGATYGAATGDTPEERAQRAVAFGVGGALVPSLLSRPGAAGQMAKIGANRRESLGRVGPLESAARGVPPVKPIPQARLMEFPSIQKMPEDVRGEIAGLMEKHGGFASQRRGVQSWERTQALSDGIKLPFAKLKPGTPLNAEEMAAYRDAVAGVMTARQPLVQKIQSGAATDVEKLELSKLTDEAIVLMESYRGAKAEAGRALGILRAKARVLEHGDARLIEEAIKAPGFDGNIKRLAGEITKAGDDPVKQLELLRTYNGGLYDKATAAYYAGLLSGVKTHLRNLIGNTSNMLANLANPIGAVPVDVVRGKLTGKPREVFLAEIPEAVRATFVALPDAMRDAVYTMRHGFTPAAVERASAGKFDTPRVELPGGLVTNWPMRALEASDAAFRKLAYSQELYASAYAQVRKSGMTRPNAIQQRVIELVSGTSALSEDLREKAATFAARATFQEDPGPFLRQIMGLKNSQAMPAPVRAAVTFIAPFMRTPGNILRQGAEFSPLGLGMKAIRQEGREGAQAAGRVALGSMALAPFAYMAATGKLSGAGPQDRGERAALMERGWRPNSVKIGDTSVGFQQLQPFSVALAAMANGYEKFLTSDRSDEDAETSLTQALAAVGTSFLDQSFLAGLSDFLDAVSDPDRNAEFFLSRFSQGLVPASGMLRNITQAVDPVVRQPEGVAESVKTIIPGLSESVPARRGRQGQVITRPGGPLWRGFGAPEISPETTTDPVAALWERVGLTPQVPRGDLQMDGQQVPLTREQTNLLQQARGASRQRVLRQFLTPRFARLPIETQRGVVENATAEASRQVTARAQALIRRRRPLTLEALVPADTR